MAEGLFEWDETNLEHLEKHGFSRADAEAVITDPRRVRVDSYNARGEKRYGVIGRGTGGDILHVVFVLRGSNIRPFHCRAATPAEKRRYKR